MWWKKKADLKDMQFSSRAEAFAYMLKYQLEEKKADPMEAAEKAGQFADIFAANTGLPGKIEPQPEGLDKYLQMADKVVCYCDEHPRVIDFLSGAATFAVGLFTGKKVSSPAPAPPVEKIDFSKID